MANTAAEPFWLMYLYMYKQILVRLEREYRIYDPTQNEDSHLCLKYI